MVVVSWQTEVGKGDKLEAVTKELQKFESTICQQKQQQQQESKKLTKKPAKK